MGETKPYSINESAEGFWLLVHQLHSGNQTWLTGTPTV